MSDINANNPIHDPVCVRVRVRACVRACVHVHMYAYVMWYVNMGWLRLVGSLKLWVSFAEYSLFYRALLQKRPTIFRSLPSDVVRARSLPLLK